MSVKNKAWKKKFATILSNKLLENDLTIIEFADRADIYAPNLYAYLSGEVSPNATTVWKMARALGCTTDELINFDVDE